MALSILLICLILDPLFSQFGPRYSLLSRRDFGKIAFLIIVILHFGALIFFSSKALLPDFVESTILFFVKDKWLPGFLKAFIAAGTIFGILFLILLALSNLQIVEPLPVFTQKRLIKFSIGLVAAFTLAWSEELIFRGALYKYLVYHSFSPFWGAVIASIIFSLSHNLVNPLSLVWPNWPLGLGLFLLGLLLNLLYIVTNKLYVNMGFHAGLVFAGRVIYRAFPFYAFVLPLPWWLNKDLRSAFIVQIIFGAIILFLLFRFKDKIFALPTIREQTELPN
ncbi:MAG: CPBP family glutamic-type intramembrane protease [Candidatus Caenarcaniphilales bacterium]|nr:CPBP family glutamic-type intramembrane protease [Candidatus Caenarcaniphilales bacterium]